MKKITLIAMLLYISVTSLNAQQQNLTIYGNMLLDDAQVIKASHPNEIEILEINGEVAAVHISEEATHLLHELKGHGPGYRYAADEFEALQDLRKVRYVPLGVNDRANTFKN